MKDIEIKQSGELRYRTRCNDFLSLSFIEFTVRKEWKCWQHRRSEKVVLLIQLAHYQFFSLVIHTKTFYRYILYRDLYYIKVDIEIGQVGVSVRIGVSIRIFEFSFQMFSLGNIHHSQVGSSAKLCCVKIPVQSTPCLDSMR